MISAWALLIWRDCKCRCAFCREPTSVTGRMSGIGGLPAWWPSGISAGQAACAPAAAGAASGDAFDAPFAAPLDEEELEDFPVTFNGIVRSPLSDRASQSMRCAR